MLPVYFYFVVTFLFSSLYLTNMFNSTGSTLIAAMIAFSLPVTFLFKKTSYKFPTYSLLVMYLFLLMVSLAAWMNNDLSLLTSGTIVVILYIAAFVIVPSIVTIDVNRVIYRSILISHIPLICLPLIIYGLNTDPYEGIFYNPNSFGSVAATIFSIIFAVFISKLENYYTNTSANRSFSGLLLYLVSILFFAFMVVVSGSRTSTLAIAGIIILGLLFLIYNVFKSGMIPALLKSFFWNSFGAIIIFMLVKFTPFYDYLQWNIIRKFQMKLGHGDVLDNRGYVWQQTMNEAGAFGKGSDYFQTQTVASAHNTFIGIIGEYGWATLVLFVLFLVISAVSAVKYAVRNPLNSYKYLPIFLLTIFIVLSMGEGMLFKLSMIAMFFSLGAAATYKKAFDISAKRSFSIKRKTQKGIAG